MRSNGYSDPKEPTKVIKQIRSSWRLKSGTQPDGPGGRYDGTFINDWQYVDGAGDLNESNARFSVTPEYPKDPPGGGGRHGGGTYGGGRHGGPPPEGRR